MNEYNTTLNQRHMVCRNCAHEETFNGSFQETLDEAKEIGWRVFHIEGGVEKGKDFAYCEDC
jgi:hypothetical protein